MGRSSRAVAVVIFAFSLQACGGEGASPSSEGALPADSPSIAAEVQLDGCVPACPGHDGGRITPMDLPDGEYQTDGFFGGAMSVAFDAGWVSPEDSSGEFSATPKGQDDLILFWEDVYPLEDGKRVRGVPRTVGGLLDWMGSSSQLDISAPEPGSIGGLPATVVDVRIAAGAVDEGTPEDPCPAAVCVGFLGFPEWFGSWAIAGRQVQRFYLSDVTYGGVDHLFVAVVYPDDPADMKAFAATAAPILRTVRVPADPA
jgi:hypothetical protein